MTEPVKDPATAKIPPAEVAKVEVAVAEPEFVKVVCVKNPLPHAYDTSIRISNVTPTVVPNDGWTKCQLQAGILRLAE
jgi:hypothetical protein